MTAIIIGATAGVGRAIGREAAHRGFDLLLIARDIQSLQAEAAHLRWVYGVRVTVLSADANQAEEFARELAKAFADVQKIDALICPIGVSAVDDDGLQPVAEMQQLINTNMLSVMIAAKLALPMMLHAGRGTIVGFSSIAAVRGRSANVNYSAAKRALESYFESLRHRLSGTGVSCVVYRLGYVATQQSYGRKLALPVATPARIAIYVMDHLGALDGLVTLPRLWVPILALLRLVPWFIFKRLSF